MLSKQAAVTEQKLEGKEEKLAPLGGRAGRRGWPVGQAAACRLGTCQPGTRVLGLGPLAYLAAHVQAWSTQGEPTGTLRLCWALTASRSPLLWDSPVLPSTAACPSGVVPTAGEDFHILALNPFPVD